MPPEPPFLTEIKAQYQGFKTALKNKRFVAAQARLNNLESYKSSNLPPDARAFVQNMIPTDEFTAIIGKPTEEDFLKRSSEFVEKVKAGSATLPLKLGASAPIVSAAEQKVQVAAQMSNDEIQKKAAAGFSIYNKEPLTKKEWIDVLNERSPYMDLAVVDENGTYYYFSPRELANALATQGSPARNPITNALLNTLYAFSFDYSKPKEFPFTLVGQVTLMGTGHLNLQNWLNEYKEGGSLRNERIKRKNEERTAHIAKKFVAEGGMDKQEDILSVTPFKVLIAEKFGLKYPESIPDWKKIKEDIQAALKQGKQGTYYLAVLATTVTDQKTKKNYLESGETFYFFDVSSLLNGVVGILEQQAMHFKANQPMNPFNRQPIKSIYVYVFSTEKINEEFPFDFSKMQDWESFYNQFKLLRIQPQQSIQQQWEQQGVLGSIDNPANWVALPVGTQTPSQSGSMSSERLGTWVSPHIEPTLVEVTHADLNPRHVMLDPDYNIGKSVLTEQTEAVAKRVDGALNAQGGEKTRMFEVAWRILVRSISDMNQFMSADNINLREKKQLLDIVVQAIEGFKKALVAANFSAQIPATAEKTVDAMRGKVQGALSTTANQE
jgi:hypothetical protein